MGTTREHEGSATPHTTVRTETRRRLFARAYAAGVSGVDAAVWAGHHGTPASLAMTASRLLRRPDVQALVEQEMRLRLDAASGVIARAIEAIGTQVHTDFARGRRMRALDGMEMLLTLDQRLTESRELFAIDDAIDEFDDIENDETPAEPS